MIKENRVSKYLLYAIGEIALVMIGILLALQVNNWNEEQKDKSLLAGYTENLIEDLVQDSIRINEVMIYIKEDSTSMADIQRRVFESAAPLDTIAAIARYEYVYYIGVHTDYNNDTYEVLSSTGDIGLYDKDLTADLSALFNLQELALSTTEHTMGNFLSNMRHYVQKYPIPLQSNLLANGSPAADLVWEQISLVDHATEFNGVNIAKGDSYRLSLRYLPMVLEKTTALLAKLRGL